MNKEPLFSLNQEGKFDLADPGSTKPHGTLKEWLRCFETYLGFRLEPNPNHSAVYGKHLGFVGGPDPYFYNPANPEIQQRPPEGMSVGEYIKPLYDNCTYEECAGRDEGKLATLEDYNNFDD